MGKAWRKLKNSKKALKEMAVEMEPGANDSNYIMALFEDGSKHEIHGITTVSFKQSQVARKGAKSESTDFFVLQHETTHHRLRVASKTDRVLLMVLYEQAQQVLQVRVDAFGQDIEKAKHAAAIFVKNIAEDYASGKLKKTELKARRDDLIKAQKLGTKRTTKPLMKKPSSNLDPDSIQLTKKQKAPIQLHDDPKDEPKPMLKKRSSRWLLFSDEPPAASFLEPGA